MLILSEVTSPARFTKFAGYLHWEITFSGTEISLAFEKQDGYRGHFFKNYLPSSTGWLS